MYFAITLNVLNLCNSICCRCSAVADLFSRELARLLGDAGLARSVADPMIELALLIDAAVCLAFFVAAQNVNCGLVADAAVCLALMVLAGFSSICYRRSADTDSFGRELARLLGAVAVDCKAFKLSLLDCCSRRFCYCHKSIVV